MILIKYSKGMIKVYSEYDAKLVEIFRNLTNRRWLPSERAWQVGLSDLHDLFIPQLEANSFEYEFDESYTSFFEAKKQPVGEFNLKLPLYPFQEEGARKLVSEPFFALFDDLGVGKTVQTIAMLDKIKPTDILIICPNSLKKQWFDEISKFSTLDKVIIESTHKKKRAELWKSPATIKIVNYELMRFDSEPFKIEWDVVILDECQRIKNPFAKTTNYVKKLDAKRKYVLTGTPIKNLVTDLHSIFDFMLPLTLGTYTDYKERYLVTQQRMIKGRIFEEIIGTRNLDELAERIKPYYLRRTKEEVLEDLPELVQQKIWIELNDKEKKYYDLLKQIIDDKISRQESILGEIVLLRVLCNGEACLKMSDTANKLIRWEQSRMGESSSKVDECASLLKSILNQNGDKVIVFSDFVMPLMVLSNKLKKEEIEFNSLHGGIKDREQQLEEFKTNEQKRVLLAQTITGGVGLNLQVANHVIFLTGQWTNADREQALSRAHRSGQKKTVFVYDLIIRNSIEEKVLKALLDKRQLSERIIARHIKEFM